MAVNHENKWKKLQPLDNTILSNAQSYGNSKFMMMTDQGIMVYNVCTDTWSALASDPILSNSQFKAICFDPEGNKLHIYQSDVVYTADLIANSLHLSEVGRLHLGNSPSMVLLHSKLNLIAGSNSSSHFEANDDRNGFKKIHEFKQWESQGLHGHVFVHLKAKNECILFGGYHHANSRFPHEIWRYSVDARSWNIMEDATLPFKLYKCGHALTNDGRYLILFGGYKHDEIFVVELEGMVFMKSNVRCPVRERFVAVMESMDYNAVALLNGFIREQCLGMEVPADIVETIGVWFSFECAHVLERTEGRHWKIDVQRIFDSLVT